MHVSCMLNSTWRWRFGTCFSHKEHFFVLDGAAGFWAALPSWMLRGGNCAYRLLSWMLQGGNCSHRLPSWTWDADNHWDRTPFPWAGDLYLKVVVSPGQHGCSADHSSALWSLLGHLCQLPVADLQDFHPVSWSSVAHPTAAVGPTWVGDTLVC